MSEHIITWESKVQGNIKIEADTLDEAREKLDAMKTSELVKSSEIWQSEELPSIRNTETNSRISVKCWSPYFNSEAQRWENEYLGGDLSELEF